MTAARQYKSISPERFAAAQAGESAAMDALVQENLPLVKYIVRRFLGRGKEYDDLFQTGCVGLVKAIQKFDCTLNVRFSTYAVPLIMGEIRRFLRDDNTVHVSRSLHDLSIRINQYRQQTEKEQGSAPVLEDICSAMGVDADMALLAINSQQPVRSFSEPVAGNEEILLEDTIAATGMDGIDEHLMLQDMLASLDAEEKELILLRFFERKTQKEVGQRRGMTQVQVSRLESKILRKMRSYCDSNST